MPSTAFHLPLSSVLLTPCLSPLQVGAATQTSLATATQLYEAKSRLRRQIRASLHPAIIMWLIGNELNGAWHLFVCDEEYATTFLQPKYGITSCQFGTDAAGFLRALDNLCSVAQEEGVPCSTPLADAALPSALSSLPQVRRLLSSHLHRLLLTSLLLLPPPSTTGAACSVG